MFFFRKVFFFCCFFASCGISYSTAQNKNEREIVLDNPYVFSDYVSVDKIFVTKSGRSFTVLLRGHYSSNDLRCVAVVQGKEISPDFGESDTGGKDGPYLKWTFQLREEPETVVLSLYKDSNKSVSISVKNVNQKK